MTKKHMAQIWVRPETKKAIRQGAAATDMKMYEFVHHRVQPKNIEPRPIEEDFNNARKRRRQMFPKF